MALVNAIRPHRDAYSAKCTSGEQVISESCFSLARRRFFGYHRMGLGILDYRPNAMFYGGSELRLERDAKLGAFLTMVESYLIELLPNNPLKIFGPDFHR